MKLTTRMEEVLAGIAEGRTNQEIADRLKISPKTADKHRRKLYALYKVDNAVSLVVKAIKDGELKVSA